MSITRSALIALYVFTLLVFQATLSAAQRPGAAPRQEKLLNGLKVLVWNSPTSDKVTLKVRIHAGSAFDPQEKEGVMKLLADSLFPTPEAKSFFKEELGGNLEVVSNYDYIQINAESTSDQFLSMLETIAQAVSNPDLSKESTETLKAGLLAQLQEAERDPAYVADRAVAKRLFGTFPYGRPTLGTEASLKKLDFADLRFAKDRLLTADNATIAIRGKVNTPLALRAARRYFGSWLKSDKTVPSTFRQPDAPDAAAVKVELPGLTNSEVRYAVRGYARSSKEFATAEVLSRIMQSRLTDSVAKGAGLDAAAAHDEHILPGAFVLRYRSQATSPQLISTSSPLASLIGTPVTEGEFTSARSQVIASWNARDVMDRWLDVDTFRITSVADESKAFENVSLADVNAMAARLAREPLATAIVVAAAAPSNSAN